MENLKRRREKFNLLQNTFDSIRQVPPKLNTTFYSTTNTTIDTLSNSILAIKDENNVYNLRSNELKFKIGEYLFQSNRKELKYNVLSSKKYPNNFGKIVVNLEKFKLHLNNY